MNREETYNIKMKRGSTLYCPKCGKKADTFLKPEEHRTADYRLECKYKCTSLNMYITFLNQRKLKYDKS